MYNIKLTGNARLSTCMIYTGMYYISGETWEHGPEAADPLLPALVHLTTSVCLHSANSSNYLLVFTFSPLLEVKESIVIAKILDFVFLEKHPFRGLFYFYFKGGCPQKSIKNIFI